MTYFTQSEASRSHKVSYGAVFYSNFQPARSHVMPLSEFSIDAPAACKILVEVDLPPWSSMEPAVRP
jgi:hypothetical protein